jgi:cell division protein FtsW
MKPAVKTWEPSSIDHALLFATILTAAFGVLMVYDASAVSAALRDKFSNQYYFLIRQALWFFSGLLIVIIAVRIPPRVLYKLSLPGLGATYFLMILVLIPGIGTEIGSARRWLRLGPLSLQPGEPMRLMLILYLARFLSSRRDKINSFRDALLPAALISGSGIALLALQPKIGSAMMIAIISVGMFFVAGIPVYQMFLTGLAVTPLAFLVSGRFDYILQRVQAWMSPGDYVKNLAYQSTQSLIAIGSGGLFGTGLGQGRQKMFYLPEAHTDFIFSVISEELGLLGSITIIGGFAFILFRGLRIAQNSDNAFEQLLATGMVFSVMMPALLNLFVAVSLFPVTGVPLPLISFGGSALVTDMTALGILAGLKRNGGAG